MKWWTILLVYHVYLIIVSYNFWRRWQDGVFNSLNLHGWNRKALVVSFHYHFQHYLFQIIMTKIMQCESYGLNHIKRYMGIKIDMHIKETVWPILESCSWWGRGKNIRSEMRASLTNCVPLSTKLCNTVSPREG